MLEINIDNPSEYLATISTLVDMKAYNNERVTRKGMLEYFGPVSLFVLLGLNYHSYTPLEWLESLEYLKGIKDE